MEWKKKFRELYRVMGDDVIFPDEVSGIEGIANYTEEQISLGLSRMLPTKTSAQTDLAEQCRKWRLVLYPGPAKEMNLLQIRSLDSDYFHSTENGWYQNQKFSREDKVFPGWYLIKKDLSKPKKWKDHMRSIPYEKRIPNSAELVWAILIYEETKKQSLFEEDAVIRTFSQEDDGWRVCVDIFNRIDLSTCPEWIETPTTFVEEVSFI